MISKYDQIVKLILIGSSGVGKTSLLMQFAENKFSESYLTTIGVDFRFKTVESEGKTIKFQVWDTAGQQRFRTVTSAYYKGADGIIMVYDLAEPSSLDDIENYWLPEVFQYCDKSIRIMLVGNKCDGEHLVSKEKVNKIVDKYSVKTEEVSAKASTNVVESFTSFGISVANQKTDKGILPPPPKAERSQQVPKVQKNVPVAKNVPASKTASIPIKQEPSFNASTKPQSKYQYPKEQATISLSSKPRAIPNYSKKCC